MKKHVLSRHKKTVLKNGFKGWDASLEKAWHLVDSLCSESFPLLFILVIVELLALISVNCKAPAVKSLPLTYN